MLLIRPGNIKNFRHPCNSKLYFFVILKAGPMTVGRALGRLSKNLKNPPPSYKGEVSFIIKKG